MKIIDIIILVAYLCGIMFLGSFIGKRTKKEAEKSIYPVGVACHGMLSVFRLA